MNKSDMKQTVRWAVIGAVATIGVLGLTGAIGQQAISTKVSSSIGHIQAKLGDMEYSGTFDRAQEPNFVLKLDVTNHGNATTKLDQKVALVLRQFTGDMMSRVPRPGDVKLTVLERRDLRGTVHAGATRTFTIKFKSVAEAPRSSNNGGTTYLVRLESADKKPTVAASVPRLRFVKAK